MLSGNQEKAIATLKENSYGKRSSYASGETHIISRQVSARRTDSTCYTRAGELGVLERVGVQWTGTQEGELGNFNLCIFIAKS